MSSPSSSLIEISSLSHKKISSLFLSAVNFKINKDSERLVGKSGALLFFEPSTRTRFSFEMACANLGLSSLLLDGAGGTSLEKGESLEDTVFNVAAMGPDFLVIRCGDDANLLTLQEQLEMPVINAGWGKRGHPTQALLDALTLQAHGRDFSTEKLLVIGDVKHSRVVGSHFELAKILGYELAICGPKEFVPEDYKGRYFDKLSEGLKWATSVMAVRVQHERHAKVFSADNYHQEYGLNLQRLQAWDSDGLLLHPGPVNYGVELAQDVNQDPRCKILEQVSWGVCLRQAILSQIFAEKGTQ